MRGHTLRKVGARVWIAFAIVVAPFLVAIAYGPSVRAQTTSPTDLQTTKTPDPTTNGTDLTTTTGGGTTLETSPTPHPTWAPTPHPTTKPTESASASESTSTSASGDDLAPQPLPPAPSKKGNARREIDAGVGDVSVKASIPADWPELDDDALPDVDAASMQDAKIAARAGYGWNAPKDKKPKVQELVVVCGKAQTELWADNIRDAAFVSMVDGVEDEAKKFTDLNSIDPPAFHTEGDRFVQPFSAEANFTGEKSEKGGKVRIEGLSFLGFVTDNGATTLVGCTVTCAQLLKEGDPDVCVGIAQSIEIKGSFLPAPKPSWWAQFLFNLKRDKTTFVLLVVGVVFFIALIVVVVMMLRRRKAEAAAGPDDHDDGDFDAGYEAGLAAARAEMAKAASNPPPQINVVSSPPGALPPISVKPAPAASVSSPPVSIEVLVASDPPPQGYFDPVTMERR